MERILRMLSPITERIIELDPSLKAVNEGTWSNTTTLYDAFNDAGVECEVGEFLYSMTRIMKPRNVLETGTHHGIGATYIGHALADNEHGELYTVEFLQNNYEIAKQRIKKQGLTSVVKNLFGDAKDLEFKVGFQLIFLDTEPQTRFAELIKFYPYLEQGGFMFIHDLHRHMHQMPVEGHEWGWPYGLIPKGMDNLIKRGHLRPFHFSTPRGITGFYKESKEDLYYQIYE